MAIRPRIGVGESMTPVGGAIRPLPKPTPVSSRRAARSARIETRKKRIARYKARHERAVRLRARRLRRA